MSRPFLSLLLVPLILANPVFCIEHSHHGTGVAEPESHASRPHFHIGGNEAKHDHHVDHSHGHDSERSSTTDDDHGISCESFLRPTTDHDADAIYCAHTVTLAQNEPAVPVVSARVLAASAILHDSHQNDGSLLRLGLLRRPPTLVFDAACPIYLRTLSLRI